jgi:hypothetical protein
MYDIDLFDASASLISQLHASGRAVICYFSTQYEDWRPDASSFPSNTLGSNLDDWPGERYVDIRSSVVRDIMAARLDLAVTKGCDGVEPDNVDSYGNRNGLGLTAANQLDYNRFLAQQAHNRGLSIGLKNDLDQVSALQSYFDWALNEQCNEYSECGMLSPFVSAGKAVFGVDYAGSAGTICPRMITSQYSWLMKDLNLGAKATLCCTYAPGGCAPAAYSCVDRRAKRALYDDAEFQAAVAQAEENEVSSVLAENPSSPSSPVGSSSSFVSIPTFFAVFVVVVIALVL